MNDSRTLILGEKRYVDFFVCCKDPIESIVITDASYELIDKKTEKTEAEGACQINDRCLRILLSPEHKGIFRLVIKVEIPPETIKAVMDIVVKEVD